ncbi:MAG: 3-keto-5-aminohexanoate cleavage protein [Synergistaceae bacterium]|jgi:3-keto-5-aminohexanoate cleavage enzyme|nr:3-keto-5-aminohexanoate cleavage protein [Synergistaceae bacterium]
MSNQINKVNWDVVNALGKQFAFCARPGFYGPCDPSRSIVALPDVDIQPKWDIPEKIAISTAICGAFNTKSTNPNHPITPDEIYQSAREACLAGSPIVHIHVRNEEGFNILDPVLFHRVIDPLREEFPDVIFDGCLVPDTEELWEKMVVMLKDRLLDVTPINTTATYLGDMILSKPPHVLIEKTRLCQEYGVKPQIAVYTDADIDNADRFLIKTDLLEKPYHFLILPALPGCSTMNNPVAMTESLLNLYNRIMDVDPGAVVMVAAAGRASSYLANLAMLLGLSVRVGMEDTVWKWPHKNDRIENNAEQFKTYKTLAEILGREVCTPGEYRKMIGLPLK